MPSGMRKRKDSIEPKNAVVSQDERIEEVKGNPKQVIYILKNNNVSVI
jgi:hypothetical protein